MRSMSAKSRFARLLRCTLGCVPLLVAANARAADLGFYGLELRAGVVDPDIFESTEGLGLSVDAGEFTRGLRFYPSLFYFSTEFDGLDSFEVDVWSLGAEVRYFLGADDFGWNFGGGPYLVETDYSVSGVDVDVSNFGVQGVAAYTFPQLLSVEARYGTGFKHFGLYGVLRFGGQ